VKSERGTVNGKGKEKGMNRRWGESGKRSQGDISARLFLPRRD
jgi:hypothetical protein